MFGLLRFDSGIWITLITRGIIDALLCYTTFEVGVILFGMVFDDVLIFHEDEVISDHFEFHVISC